MISPPWTISWTALGTQKSRTASTRRLRCRLIRSWTRIAAYPLSTPNPRKGWEEKVCLLFLYYNSVHVTHCVTVCVSGREKRSPKQRKKQQINGDLTDADRDRLINNDSDGTYKKYPGVSNVAYVVRALLDDALYA